MPAFISKKSSKLFLLILLCSFSQCLLLTGQSFAKTLKIGVYSNKPLIFQDEQGKFQGLTIDVLRSVAGVKGWDLEFVPGTWPECLQRLEKGEIDLQVAIAFSSARAKQFSFPQETLITNWGRLYRNPNTEADSFLDLDGKIIGLLEKDIHAKIFSKRMESFNKTINYIYLQSYDEIMKQVEEGTVDLGVVNRMYAMQNAHLFDVQATPIIFNPIEVRYAAPKGKNEPVLRAIDHHLKLLLEDKHSVYYKSLEKWFGQAQVEKFPQWIRPTLYATGALLLLTFFISLILQKQVSRKTKDLQSIFDSSPVAVFIHNMDTSIIDMNQTMLDMYRVEKKEALTLSIADDYSSPENPRDQVPVIIQKVIDGTPQQFEWIQRRPGDGSTFPSQVNLKKIVYDGREVIYASVLDLTAQKAAEEHLASEQERLAVTLRSIGDGVIATDTLGNIIFLNKVAEELTGWKNEDAKGKPSLEVFNIINEKTDQKCVSPVQRVLELGRIVGLANHTILIAKDGTLRSIADSGAPIRDKFSKIIGVVLVFRDVTHEQKMEEELVKIRKLESIGVLAGGIAHDFNNILAAILGNIELTSFRIDKDDNKSIALLEGAKKATKRATKLTQQLLTFAKGGEPVREKTILPELITESANFVLHGSRVACHYSFPDTLWEVDVDSGQISQVIQNITINAKHAMPEGGTITICCANITDAATESLLSVTNGKYVQITIQDTGIGIPKKIINKIFDPYFSTKQEGSGLGLAICFSIINKHDGYITVDSISGKGTIFSIYLPAMLDKTSANIDIPGIAKPAKAVKVMIMDDEEMLREVAQSQLTVLGHETVLVTNGVQAINKYQELQDKGQPVDVVIMDLTVPGNMGGEEAARKLLQVDPQAKIIVASGYSNDPVMSNYRKYGFGAALSKPFDLKELNSAITSVL
jgi:PAS domain S-box-containing protein